MSQGQDDSNYYESEIRYDNDRVAYRNRPLPDPKPATSRSPPQERPLELQQQAAPEVLHSTNDNLTRKLTIAAVVLGAIGFTLQIAILVFISSTSTAQNVNASTATKYLAKQQPAKSCLQLKSRGLLTNGIYTIKPEDEFQAIETYCDMETDSGGWTLVASVHEDDIKTKCDSNDRWATYISPVDKGCNEKTNWENKRIFGEVYRCTSGDYKNSAYYSLNARDVMIWHVPSQSPTASMKDRAFSRYRTTNHFLQNVGGNLQSLFRERYPLNIKFGRERELASTRTKKVLDVMSSRSNSILGKISNWHTYTYADSNGDRITDNSMFSSYGNMIYFQTNRQSRGYFHYGQEYRFTFPHFAIRMEKIQPFMMATAISNTDGLSDFFLIQIIKYDAFSKNDEHIENNITRGEFELQYRTVGYNYPSYTSFCEFHFIVYSELAWRSDRPHSFKYVQYSTSNGQFRIDGSPSNFVMGYLLLTRTQGYKVTKQQLDEVANVVLQTVSTLTDLFDEPFEYGSLSVPITLDKGEKSALLNMVPPMMRPLVQPGYLQFRAFNVTGYPNALCPGLKVKSTQPQYVCIGGLSQDLRSDFGTCGDYAGWAGKKGDAVKNSAAGYAHASADITSTILIFYR